MCVRASVCVLDRVHVHNTPSSDATTTTGAWGGRECGLGGRVLVACDAAADDDDFFSSKGLDVECMAGMGALEEVDPLWTPSGLSVAGGGGTSSASY